MNGRLGIVLICCFIDLRMQTIKCVVVGDGAVGKVRSPLDAPVSAMCR
jgi:siroheme synthase (precorrin-2 oxidase/ferrochelatase)